MKDAVLIKSFTNGILLKLDEQSEFEELLEEIRFKFSEAKNFFKTASMALSIEGRTLSEAEEIRILNTIKKSCHVNIVCIVEHDETINKSFIKALAHVDKKRNNGEEGQLYKGDLKNNEVLETENSIIILGDVYPGSAVISAKSIIVLGGLYGEAYAGGNGKSNAFIAALEMAPERIKIGDFKYKQTGNKSKWGIRSKTQPKIAYVKNEKILLEALTKEMLSSF